MRLEALRVRLAGRVPKQIEEGDVPLAAVAAVLAPAAGGGVRLLLIRRSVNASDPWSGHMALPGGRRDAGDADLLATALRETNEEVGISLAPQQLIGVLDDLRPLSAPRRILVRPFVFAVSSEPRISASAEVAESLWSDVDALAESAGTTDVFHLGAMRSMPCYRVGSHVVWGMTQRILEPLVNLARASD